MKVMDPDSFAKGFIQQRILPQQRRQGDVNLDTGVNYLSLVAQQARAKVKKRPSKKPKLLRQFRGQTARNLRKCMRSELDVRRMTCPREMPNRLHDLWAGYAAGVIDWAGSCQSGGKSSFLTNQLENILRMDLIGSHMQICRSITTQQVVELFKHKHCYEKLTYDLLALLRLDLVEI